MKDQYDTMTYSMFPDEQDLSDIFSTPHGEDDWYEDDLEFTDEPVGEDE